MDAISTQTDTSWELVWAPYDQPTYDIVLKSIRPEDIVLEIGAGDLRLALQIAQIALKVYAIEIHPEIIQRAFSNAPQSLPKNLAVVCGDAGLISFPPSVSVGVLLMRHCTHFRLYAAKLKAAGCRKLITNARWRIDPEVIDLQQPRQAFEGVKIGWYACWCGAVGFINGPAELLTPELEQAVVEVSSCPACAVLGHPKSII